MKRIFRFFQEIRGFLILFSGQCVSQLGSEMTACALNVWAFQKTGTAMSLALLTVCHMLPGAVIGMFAGSLIDRMDKKRAMLTADCCAALVSAGVLFLAATGRLEVGHLYAVNALLGLCGAVQGPAASVAVSACVPKRHYLRVGGMQSFAGSLLGILSPVAAMAVYAFGGLMPVLAIDLCSFAFGFVTLCLTPIPPIAAEAAGEGFARSVASGWRYIRKKAGLWRLLAYNALVDLLAGIAYYSILTPMILTRAGGDEMVLGYVNGCISLGAMLGALFMLARPARGRKARATGVCFALSFALCDFLLGVGRTPTWWYIAAVLGNVTLPMGSGCLNTLYRESTPIGMQGRLFAACSALNKAAMIGGFFLGAYLADWRVEGWLAQSGFLRALVGTGEGRAMGIIFLFTSVTGALASLWVAFSRPIRELERDTAS